MTSRIVARLMVLSVLPVLIGATARLMVLSVLLMPVRIGANPQQGPQRVAPPAVPSVQVGSLVTATPIDAEHTRVVVRFTDGPLVFEANSVSMNYTKDGLAVEMSGPGLLTYRGPASPADKVSVTIGGDGRLMKLSIVAGGHKFIKR